MQRGCKGGVDVAADGELDVAQLVGHCVSVFGVHGAVEVLARSEEPVESDDGKVDDVGPAHAKLRVLAVEHFDEGSKDGDVDRVGARAGAVFLLEACAVFDPGSVLGWGCNVRRVLGAPRIGSTHSDDLAAYRLDLLKYG